MNRALLVRSARLLRMALVLLASVLLGSCAWLQDSKIEQCKAGPPLLPAQSWAQSFEQTQLLQFTRGNDRQQFISVVRRDASGLQMRLLNALGLELLALEYRQAAPELSTLAPLPDGFDAALLVADFQLLHWPLRTLQQGWVDSPWQVLQRGGQRLLSCHGRQISRVDYPAAEGQAIELSNVVAGYRLRVQPLSVPSPARNAHD